MEKKGWSGFTRSYLALHPYVRRPGPESDYHVLTPMEYHVSTSELVQKLEKGHHGVRLDQEGWDRLVTWIDLNVPDHGTWSEHRKIPGNFHQLRLEMRTKYANRPEDLEVIPEQPPYSPPATAGEAENGTSPESCSGPATADLSVPPELPAPPAATGRKMTLEAGDGTMDFVLIPAGEFMMGMEGGVADMRPLTPVSIPSPFWMSVTEVTNEHYAAFDPDHDSGVIDQHHKDHTLPGYPANEPEQPVIRVSWREAMAFCRWLSESSGKPCRLPDEAEWEWACRAGTQTPLYYGGPDDDFSGTANMADVSMSLLAVTGVNPQPIKNPNEYQNFLPQDARFDDGQKIVAPVASYTPNPWGLHDMHGNVAEWTLSRYQPYPWDGSDGRNDPAADGLRVARGGSWRDRPCRCQSAYRFAYQPWQKVFNTGFRVIIPADSKKK
jgi:formylglycine-generating enzyme required for sulfatase activity